MNILQSVFAFPETEITGRRARIIISAITLMIVAASVWQGFFNLDPHHWGLMLSNASDLTKGKLPYREIFIQYGFLSTVIHAIALKALGGSLWSLIAVTSAFYAFGLTGIYSISLKLGASQSEALAAFVLCALLHPIAIYPWSNYLAFPFLTWGLLALIPPHRKKIEIFFGGVILGGAILCREGLFLPIAVFSMIYCTTLFFTTPNSQNLSKKLANSLLSLIGTASVLTLFFLYLNVYEILPYWYKLGIELPRIYADSFFKSGVIDAATNLVKYLGNGSLQGNPRIIYIALIGLFSAYTATTYVFKKNSKKITSSVFLTAVLTLLLFSASMHLNEIFRLATGIALGAGIVFIQIRSPRVKSIFFWLLLLTMTVTLASKDNGNYFFPSKKTRSESIFVSTPYEFYGQRWPVGVDKFYINFKSDMHKIEQAECGVNFHYNETKDAFLATLSPFNQYQVSPFGHGMHGTGSFSQLRPEINLDKKILDAADIVLFKEVENNDIGFYQPPANFAEISRNIIPRSRFFPEENWLLILVPMKCAQKITQNSI